MNASFPGLAHLRSGGVSVLVDLTADLPRITHWGAELPGDLAPAEAAELVRTTEPPVAQNNVDLPVTPSLVPGHWTGWTGRPGLVGHRTGGRDWSPRFAIIGARLDPDKTTLEVDARDESAGLALALTVALAPSGLLRTAARLTNIGTDDYFLDELGLTLPVPDRAAEVLDFAGHWGNERVPQRAPLGVGVHLREGRKGRTGPDAAYLLSAGEPGFGFATGQVWGVHLGWSGNHRHWAERLFNGHRTIGAADLLLPGEMVLGPGESYATPWLYASYGDGLDDQAARLHAFLRERAEHPRRPRPVTINVWEAVYFDHDLTKLRALADAAAAAGAERYVLDDGWFGARRDDRAGLGDWVVSPDVWPDGLGPLVDHVRGLGMEFGLWVEPEMINADSDVARAHPEWIMATGDRLPVESRHQQVINLGIDQAYAHVRDQLVAVLEAYPIAYLKWDHNRDLIDAGTAPSGRPGVHEQTLAAYRLMAELKDRFPGLEIESCSSGGARVDLGVLAHTDRVWASDCIDPLERQQIHRWTTQLITPELMGAHIASGHSHTTRRRHTLHFRAGTAFWGHLGIEWDLTGATDGELAELSAWVALHKEHRALLHRGRVVRLDPHTDNLDVHGVVAPDRSEALFAVVSTGSRATEPAGRIRLRGLDPDRRYLVRDITPPPGPDLAGYPAGWPGAGVTLAGAALTSVGIAAPVLHPDQLVLLHLAAH